MKCIPCDLIMFVFNKRLEFIKCHLSLSVWWICHFFLIFFKSPLRLFQFAYDVKQWRPNNLRQCEREIKNSYWKLTDGVHGRTRGERWWIGKHGVKSVITWIRIRLSSLKKITIASNRNWFNFDAVNIFPFLTVQKQFNDDIISGTNKTNLLKWYLNAFSKPGSFCRHNKFISKNWENFTFFFDLSIKNVYQFNFYITCNKVKHIICLICCFKL